MCFAVMAGIGFDAAMIRDAPEGLKGLLGWPAYLVGAIRGIRRRRVRVSISLDGEQALRQRVRTVLIGNVGRLQGGLRLLPDAEPDDGVLDVGVVDPRHAADWLLLMVRVLRGDHGRDRRWTVYQARQVAVRAERPQPRQVDGELIEAGTELRVGVRAGVLQICAPTN
jgi:diacylglycerol kinase (ATP)